MKNLKTLFLLTFFSCSVSQHNTSLGVFDDNGDIIISRSGASDACFIGSCGLVTSEHVATVSQRRKKEMQPGITGVHRRALSTASFFVSWSYPCARFFSLRQRKVARSYRAAKTCGVDMAMLFFSFRSLALNCFASVNNDAPGNERQYVGFVVVVYSIAS